MAHKILSMLCLVFTITACNHESSSTQSKGSPPVQDRISQINAMGSIDIAQAQENLRNNEPFMITSTIGVSPNPSAFGKGYSKIDPDNKTRFFTLVKPSDPSYLILEDVNCESYKLKIRGENQEWFDAEADKVSGQIAYAICHLPASRPGW
jgi:hypothetical protein